MRWSQNATTLKISLADPVCEGPKWQTSKTSDDKKEGPMGKRRRSKKEPVVLNLAVAWYKPGQWLRLKEVSEDADQLEESYGEWQINAEKALKDFAAQGARAQKVEIDINELLAWCREKNLPVNGASRSQYAAFLLRERDTKPSKMGST